MITNKRLLCALLALATPALAPADESKLATPMLKNLSEQQFVTDADVMGMKQIRMSQLAVETTQNDQVRKLADRLAAEQTAINNKLEALASQEHLNCPPTNMFASNDPLWYDPMVEHPETVKDDHLLTTKLPNLVDYQDIRHLRGLMGGEFDVAYVKDVVTDHINLVNEYTAASENMTDPKLRKFAADMLPEVRRHSQMAQRLEDQLAGQTAGPDSAKPAIPPVATATDGDK